MEKLDSALLEIKVKTHQLDAELREIKKENMELKAENKRLIESHEKLEMKMDHLKNHSRRSNLIFHGLPPATDKESWEECKSLVKNVITNHLKVDIDKGKWPSMGSMTGALSTVLMKLNGFIGSAGREVDGRKKLDIHAHQGTVCDLLKQLAGDLNSPTKGTTFVKHLFTAYWQQSQVVIVQDFAKNRKATYSQEVKSTHLGKSQISLPPSGCFYKNADEQRVRHVAMFFSDDIGHDYHAVHCFTKKVVDLIKEDNTDEVILWSDGAASQYKGWGTFADLSLYPFSVQRNFFRSEHGKGEADGETGRFSQAMAMAVAGGKCFRNARDMINFGTSTYTSSDLKK